jgi:hypothetical protein
MSYMTRLAGCFDTDDIKCGMAHFEGTGPAGKSCGDCVHRGYYRKGKDRFNPRTNLIEESSLVHRAAGCFASSPADTGRVSMRTGRPANFTKRNSHNQTAPSRTLGNM